MAMFLNKGELFFETAVGSFGTQGIADLRDDKWHHVAVSRTGGIVTYYVDGQNVYTKANNSNISSTQKMTIGAAHPSIPNATRFKGSIRDVRVWTTARTGAEIAANMNATLTGNEPNLRHLWLLNKGNGQVVTDLRFSRL